MKKIKSAVIGNNVTKSLSPEIFNYWFQKYSIQGSYGFINIGSKNLNKNINKIFYEKKLCGLNITIPFKEEIVPHLDHLDTHSKIIGAVNCVTIKNGKTYGSNTDWQGYTNTLLEKTKKTDRRNKEALVIGYGGASRAIIYALLRLEYKKIHVFNRTLKKTKNINNKKIEVHEFSKIENFLKKSNLIVNTTPVNIFAKMGLPKIINPKIITSDIVYKPVETSFLKHFINPKQKTYGIDMLVHQAIPCFEKWYGIKPNIDAALLKTLKRKIAKW